MCDGSIPSDILPSHRPPTDITCGGCHKARVRQTEVSLPTEAFRAAGNTVAARSPVVTSGHTIDERSSEDAKYIRIAMDKSMAAGRRCLFCSPGCDTHGAAGLESEAEHGSGALY